MGQLEYKFIEAIVSTDRWCQGQTNTIYIFSDSLKNIPFNQEFEEKTDLFPCTYFNANHRRYKNITAINRACTELSKNALTIISIQLSLILVGFFYSTSKLSVPIFKYIKTIFQLYRGNDLM